MTSRRNFGAKAKRIRSLILAAITSSAALFAIFLNQAVVHSSGLNSGYDTLSTELAYFFASNPAVLLAGCGIAANSLRSELLKKRKNAWSKELFGSVFVGYIFLSIFLWHYLSVNSSDVLSSWRSISTAANIVLHTYLASIWISIACIWAGKS